MRHDINVTEVENFARQLSGWAGNMKSMQSTMTGKARSLEAVWKDDRLKPFVDSVSTHAQMMKSSIEQFENMSRSLQNLAKDLEAADKNYGRNMRN